MKRIFFYSIFFANLAITLFFWWSGSSALITNSAPGTVFIAFGRLFGLIAMLLILTQLVLIGRIRPVEQEFGHDKQNNLHRLIGKYLLYLLVLHPVFLTYGYATGSQISLWSQFLNFLTKWDDVWKAFIAFILICIIVFLAVFYRKKLKYETWYFTHLFIYVAIFLLFTHQTKTADVSGGPAYFYWYLLNFGVFGLFLLYRFVRPLYLFAKHRFYVEKIIKESDTVTSVYITGYGMGDFKFTSGQFANLNFLQKGMWFTHPFSFSQAYNGTHNRHSIKNVGDYTSKIHNLKPGTRVIVDGPLGAFTEKKSKRNRYLFIAGGIGITPIRSMIETLSKKNADMVLLYGNRNEKEIVFKEELKKFNVKGHIILSAEDNPKYEKGYINAEVIKRLVPDYIDREVFLCGPPIMMEIVIKELQKLGVPLSQIHFERFEY